MVFFLCSYDSIGSDPPHGLRVESMRSFGHLFMQLLHLWNFGHEKWSTKTHKLVAAKNINCCFQLVHLGSLLATNSANVWVPCRNVMETMVATIRSTLHR